jgi:hypothetical protein
VIDSGLLPCVNVIVLRDTLKSASVAPTCSVNIRPLESPGAVMLMEVQPLRGTVNADGTVMIVCETKTWMREKNMSIFYLFIY